MDSATIGTFEDRGLLGGPLDWNGLLSIENAADKMDRAFSVPDIGPCVFQGSLPAHSSGADPIGGHAAGNVDLVFDFAVAVGLGEQGAPLVNHLLGKADIFFVGPAIGGTAG